ncbi:UDP-2,4-diacetamido-2,4,6-trideoxy-beta-L-altropyranose hydrolase [Desulfofundulus thermobenzoicus]|nr:UDP-2,4-diacetamido-2,4,6-trideoxy-beta-L-altropyranose hydrolase [Desulfofundulus thermobenzoicus]
MGRKIKIPGDKKKVAVLFRLDANRKTGLGHLSRCLNLAEECMNRGWAAYFAGSFDHNARTRIATAGGEILRNWPEEYDTTLEPPRELALLHKAAEVTGARVLVTDCYTLPADYHLEARELFPLVVMIDDLNVAPPAADILINHNIFAPHLAYRPVFPETKLLLGPRYALLPAAIRTARKKEIRPEVKNILVSLGGSDPPGLTLKVVKALQLSWVGTVWNVVAGPGFAKREILKDLAASDRRVNFHYAPGTLLPLLAESDLVICAGGVTAIEAAATGTPALILILAENQQPNAKEMDRQGIAVNLGWGGATPVEAMAAEILALARDVERRTTMSETGRALFDGYGPVRCADAIQELLGSGEVK